MTDDTARQDSADTQACEHQQLHLSVNFVGFEDTNVRYLEIKVKCKTCDRRMRFRGLPLGLSPHRPTGELGGFEVRLPFLAEGEELEGQVVGFTGRFVEMGND